MLITSKTKDEVLNWLSDNVPLGETRPISFFSLSNETSIDIGTLKELIVYFDGRGLVKAEKYNQAKTIIFLKLTVDAHDLLRMGGFEVIDALTEANIQKLLYELDNLKRQMKPDQLDVFNKVAQIVSSIVTVVAPFVANK